MCAEEFASFLDTTRKAPIEEKINAFCDIIEKIMQIILKIPDLVDISLQDVNSKVSNLQNQLTAINRDISSLKSRSGGSPAAAAAVVSSAPGGPPGGPPRSPPPPPGAPPGGPAPRPAPSPGRPAQPVSLRGAIMGELKSLFAKRKGQSG